MNTFFLLIAVLLGAFIIYPLIIYLINAKPKDTLDGIDYSNLYGYEFNDCEFGKFLGNDDETATTATCSSLCGEGEFIKVLIDQNNVDKFTVGGKKFSFGYWCFPQRIEKCNLNTSILVVGQNNKLECISRFPQLLNGNKIIGCNPHNTLVDRKENLFYTKTIPYTLDIKDLDERLDNGKFRYECFMQDGQISGSGTDIGSRFDLFTTNCNLLSASGTGPIFDDKLGIFKCKCDQNRFINNDETSLCTDCSSGFGIIDEFIPQPGSQYGYSIGIDCIDPEHDNYSLGKLVKIPCGVKTLKRIRNADKKLGCMRALVDASNTYSPATLETILKVNV